MFAQRECNWLQALEGDIDTSHFGFLHVGSVRPEQVADDNLLKYQVGNRAPAYHVADTDWGTMYSAYRPAEDGKTYWRFAHFGFPFWTWVPQGDITDRVQARAWVPMDDTHTMFISLTWKKMSRMPPLKDGQPIPGAKPEIDYLPATSDWYRAVASGGQRGERLPDRPRRAAQRHRSTPGSATSTCRIRRSPKAWGRSLTTASSISRPATR